jgi:hypothetical protein
MQLGVTNAINTTAEQSIGLHKPSLYCAVAEHRLSAVSQ